MKKTTQAQATSTQIPHHATAIRKLSPYQRDTLGRIAIGDDRFIHPKTAEALQKRGLIVSRKETHSCSSDRFRVVVTRYDVPIPVHMAWCEWCSEQEDVRG